GFYPFSYELFMDLVNGSRTWYLRLLGTSGYLAYQVLPSVPAHPTRLLADRPTGPSGGHVAAVHRQRMPGDIGGVVRAQVDRGVGDLAGFTEALDRLGGDHRLADLRALLEHPHQHRRADRPGTHGIDADLLGGIVQRRRLGQPDHRVLGSGVLAQILHPDQAGIGRRIDDGP